MKNLLTEKNDHPLWIEKRFLKCRFTLAFMTKHMTA